MADAAREAFVYAMSRDALVTAAIALVGAFVAWRFLPAHATEAGVVLVVADDEPAAFYGPELAEAG